ncbi:MAG: hypothetical protein P8141_10210 [Gammaproteobacteria bacterium]
MDFQGKCQQRVSELRVPMSCGIEVGSVGRQIRTVPLMVAGEEGDPLTGSRRTPGSALLTVKPEFKVKLVGLSPGGSVMVSRTCSSPLVGVSFTKMWWWTTAPAKQGSVKQMQKNPKNGSFDLKSQPFRVYNRPLATARDMRGEAQRIIQVLSAPNFLL